MRDERLPNIVMRAVMVGEETRGQPAKRLQHHVPECCATIGIEATTWTYIVQDKCWWYRAVTEGAKKCMTDWTNVCHAEEFEAVSTLQ